MKKASIAGITGQDGACLAEFLPAKGYGVPGITSLFGRPFSCRDIVYA